MSEDSNKTSIWINIAKKTALVTTLYLLGYTNQSFLWVVIPLACVIWSEEGKKKRNARRDFVRNLSENEKETILRNIKDLPAWVYFPDIDRAEWLNKIIKQLWPHINNYAKDLMSDSVGPNLKKNLDSYKLTGFKFERMILGNVPCRIGGVIVYEHDAKDEIVMDMDLAYAGDCNITFKLLNMKCGIKNFQIYGRIRVVMKPLISSIPFTGGVQAYFLENPNIDFDLIGLTQMFDIPGASELVRKAVVDTVASMMVYPNKYSIELSKEVSTLALLELPKGILRVHMVEAKNLMRKDINLIGKGKSDPYGILRIGNQTFKSKVIDRNLNPIWDEWFEFNISETSGQQLLINLFDKDNNSSDESLGDVAIPIENLLKSNEPVDMWIKLQNAAHGDLHLRVIYKSFSTDYSDLKLAQKEVMQLGAPSLSSCLLTVVIDSASNLPMAKAETNPDPYVVIQIGKREYKTKTQLRTIHPSWREQFSFFGINPDYDSMNLKIVDEKTKQTLGTLTYNINHISDKDNLEVLRQPFRLNTTEGKVTMTNSNESSIILSIALRVLKADEVESNVVVEDPIDNNVNNVEPEAPAQEDTPLRRESTADSISRSSDLETEINEKRNSIAYNNFSSYGKVKLTLKYSPQRQRLVVIVHEVIDIPLKNPEDFPDIYVKLYLLPERAKDSKRKTSIKKNCQTPVYDETLEYLISQTDLDIKKLEVSVVEDKKMKNPILGMVILDLKYDELLVPTTKYYELESHKKHM